MRVLLLRHGEAVDTRTASSDHDRWLTDAGRETLTAVGELFAQMNLRFTSILTSPLVRAVQSAEILAATQPGFAGPVRVHRALASEEGTTAQALAPLDEAADDDLVVMVTHMPKVGVLAAELATLATPLDFRTSACLLVEGRGGRGRAIWMLDPQTFELRRF